MAAPHVAGAAALVESLPIPSAYDYDADGRWDPEEVKKRLADTATDLGDPGFDIYMASGW